MRRQAAGYGTARQADSCFQSVGCFGHGVRGAVEIPIVIDRLVILVEAYDGTDVGMIIHLDPGAACPESSGLDQNVGASVDDEVVVRGCAPVLPDRVCDVGADVVLLLARQDGNDAPVGRNDRTRRRSSPLSADSHA
jgi:hypothetical protein